jgi:membrane protein implicated in regulation of membrane protease activity
MELQQHLEDALNDGRDASRVVGDDPEAFAESWAAEYRRGNTGVSWSDVTSGRHATRRGNRRWALTYFTGGAALVAGVIAGTAMRGAQVEDQFWRWVWTILAVSAAIAEIFTAGFFLLPIAIGAAAAAILAWFGVNAIAQWLVFFGVSAIAFAYLRRFAQQQDAHQPKVGANRWLDARGVTISDIAADGTHGMVRVEGEEWRAVSDAGPIPGGTPIAVIEVRGSKMVVRPVE